MSTRYEVEADKDERIHVLDTRTGRYVAKCIPDETKAKVIADALNLHDDTQYLEAQGNRKDSLEIAHVVLLARAAMDTEDYEGSDRLEVRLRPAKDDVRYDTAKDPEGYVASILLAMMHHCQAQKLLSSVRFSAEYNKAVALFEADMRALGDDT